MGFYLHALIKNGFKLNKMFTIWNYFGIFWHWAQCIVLQNYFSRESKDTIKLEQNWGTISTNIINADKNIFNLLLDLLSFSAIHINIITPDS